MTKKQKVCREEDQAYRPYERDDIRKKKRNSYGKLNSFTWSPTEEFLYVEFLKLNQNLFVDVQERKKSKVFVAMSHHVKKRGPDQCRSHHQKMSIKYGSIESIIEKITEEKINKPDRSSQQENSTSQQKTTQCHFKQEFSQSMEKQIEVQPKEEIIGISEFQEIHSSDSMSLWDILCEDVFVNQ